MKRLHLTFVVIIAVFTLFACKDKPMDNDADNNALESNQISNPPSDCSLADDPIICEQLKRTSKPLRELSQSDANKLIVTCDDKFRNEEGECEIPNHPHPKELIKKIEQKQ